MKNEKKILLHVCCAPCTTYTLETLRENGFEVTAYWFNHNIHPYTEYRKRLESFLYYAQKVNLPVIIDDNYLLETFLMSIKDDYAFPNRCSNCYDMRIERTATTAALHKFDYFTSTLLYSKYQKHEIIRTIGENYAELNNIGFHYDDFRKGWREGIEISKKIGLYRQQYCGCIFSERDRFEPKI